MITDLKYFLFCGSALCFSLILALCICIVAYSIPYPIIYRSKKEKYFINPITGEEMEFPSINDKSTVNLSVIVPAYDEQDRLPQMLDECIDFLEKRQTQNTYFTYEVIVVSDGSKDKTVEISLNYSKKYGTDKIRVLNLYKNRGKGGAVRLGTLSSRGALILFADADGATKFEDIQKLENSMAQLTNIDYMKSPSTISDKDGIVVGSRAHLETESIATRTIFRTILMIGFHFLVWLFAVKSVKDTQCGFKLFTRRSAEICFSNLHVERWAFDVELLYIAETLHIPIIEVPVRWTEIDGSKVTPVWSWIQMGRDLVLIWLRHTLGAWRIKDHR